jgi:SAM-dependent methyltransferase
VANAAELPFADGQFDAITCRMGVMFFPRERGLAELRRVLRPGGRIGFTVWGEYDHNPWITCIQGPVLRRVQRPPETTGGPDPFRYARPGSLAEDLRRAGFLNVDEQVARLTWSFTGTPRQFWVFQSDLGGAWSRPGWDTLSPDEQQAAEAEAIRLLEPYRDGERLNIPVELNVAAGRR